MNLSLFKFVKYQSPVAIVAIARLLLATIVWCAAQTSVRAQLPINEDDTVCLVGNEMALGMGEAGFWETLLQSRWTEANLSVRCLGNSGFSMQLDAAPLTVVTIHAGRDEVSEVQDVVVNR